MSLFPLHQGGRAGKTNAANSCDSVGGCGVISLWHQKRDVKKKETMRQQNNAPFRESQIEQNQRSLSKVSNPT